MKKNLYTIVTAALTMLTISAVAQNISTVAGTGTNGFGGDGAAATAAQLSYPGNAIVDGVGNIYIADKANYRIRKVNTSGIISTIAGIGTSGLSGDGGAATAAQLFNPVSLCLDAAGNLYIADFGNHRVRKINTSGIISTFAGSYMGLGGDGGAATAAQINNPTDVAADAAGNIYICDMGNHRIRKVDPSGIISTFAGSSTGYSGDGGAATAAQMYAPNGVCIDNSGNVFIADLGNSVVRKVDAAGIITTYAGSTPGFSGDGGPATAAKLNNPSFLTTDIAGNVFVSDMGNHVVRRASTDGLIYTIAGNNNSGWTGDGGPATAAKVGSPTGLCFDANNNLYITSQPYGAIRKVDVATIPITGPATLCITDTTTISGIVPCGLWTSSNPAVATVGSSSGLVTGVSTGTATISYNMGLGYGTTVITASACPLSAQQVINGTEPNIYPNPSAGSFTVDLPQGTNAAVVTITDMLGKEVETRTVSRTQPLVFSNIPSGSYLVKVTARDHIYRSKITVIK